MKAGGSLSIWFFVGLSLLVNGLLIFASGIYELIRPPAAPVVLFHLHASVWWGGLLAVAGAAYCMYFAPGKGRV